MSRVADIRLLGLPIGGRSVASSRIRCYDLVKSLPSRLHAEVLAPERSATRLPTMDPCRYDVVYVQKDARPATVEFCYRVADAGVPIVYDIDDDFGCWPGMDEASMCKLATTVTVDSAGRSSQIRQIATGPVTVLPCMIDLADDVHRAARRQPSPSIIAVASFGNLVSLVHTLPYLAAVRASRTFLVGPADRAAELPGVELVPFDLRTFVPALMEADVCVLAHGLPEAPLKDNNRLIMAFSLGLVSLVSPSPAYLEVLEALGVGWLACAPSEVPDRLARVADPRTRATIGAAGEAYAWAHYSPAESASRFERVLHTALDGTR